MAKEQRDIDIATMQPDEINALRAVVKEFVDRMQNIDNEIETLKGDRKELVEEFKEKLDYSTLQAALRVIKIQNKVQRRDAYDLFLEVLQDPAQ